MYSARRRERLFGGSVGPNEPVECATTVFAREDRNRWWNLALVPGHLVMAQRDGRRADRSSVRVPLCGISWLGILDQGKQWNMLLMGDQELYELQSAQKGSDPFATHLLGSLMSLPAAQLVYDFSGTMYGLSYNPFRPGCYSTWSCFSKTEGNGLISDDLMSQAVHDYFAAYAGHDVPHVSLRAVPQLVPDGQMVQSWVQHHVGSNEHLAVVTAGAQPATLAAIVVHRSYVSVISLRMDERSYPPRAKICNLDQVSVQPDRRVVTDGDINHYFVTEEDKGVILAALAEAKQSFEVDSSGVDNSPRLQQGTSRRLGIRRPS